MKYFIGGLLLGVAVVLGSSSMAQKALIDTKIVAEVLPTDPPQKFQQALDLAAGESFSISATGMKQIDFVVPVGKSAHVTLEAHISFQ